MRNRIIVGVVVSALVIVGFEPALASVIGKEVSHVDKDKIDWKMDDGGLQIVTFTNVDGYRCTVAGDKADGADGAPSGAFTMECDFSRR
jgi:hypothetical protein